MKFSVTSLLILSVAVSGCESADLNNDIEDVSATKQGAVEKAAVVKNSGCGMSPPVLNKQKIQDMLIKSGKISSGATKEEMAAQVKQYILNKQRAFAKKCRL